MFSGILEDENASPEVRTTAFDAKNSPRHQIAKTFLQCREQLGLSHKEVKKRSGVPIETIRRIEAGGKRFMHVPLIFFRDLAEKGLERDFIPSPPLPPHDIWETNQWTIGRFIGMAAMPKPVGPNRRSTTFTITLGEQAAKAKRKKSA